MHSWTIVGIVILAMCVFLVKELTGKTSQKAQFKYTAKPLLTPATKEAYSRLRTALPERLIFAEVKLAQFLEAQGPAYQRIKELAADFVICDQVGTVTAVIEIDDRTHNRSNQKARDQKKDAACKSAGIKVFRWQATKLPTPAEMRAELSAPTNTEPPAN